MLYRRWDDTQSHRRRKVRVYPICCSQSAFSYICEMLINMVCSAVLKGVSTLSLAVKAIKSTLQSGDLSVRNNVDHLLNLGQIKSRRFCSFLDMGSRHKRIYKQEFIHGLSLQNTMTRTKSLVRPKHSETAMKQDR